jgi:hypothetical protein
VTERGKNSSLLAGAYRRRRGKRYCTSFIPPLASTPLLWASPLSCSAAWLCSVVDALFELPLPPLTSYSVYSCHPHWLSVCIASFAGHLRRTRHDRGARVPPSNCQCRFRERDSARCYSTVHTVLSITRSNPKVPSGYKVSGLFTYTFQKIPA